MSTHQSTTRSRAVSVCGITGSVALLTLAAVPASAQNEVEAPDTFTSAFTTMATPDQVVNADGEPTPGPEGAAATFTFMVNSDEEIICYDITAEGFTGPYESPARTATHIHDGEAGASGPPVIAFPDPSGEGEVLTSSGCMQAPFVSGVEGADGVDTGESFSLAELEADPAGYYADTHPSTAVPGAVRGQLTEIPVGGVDTGFGGTAEADGAVSSATLAAGALALAGLTGAGLVAARRHGRG